MSLFGYELFETWIMLIITCNYYYEIVWCVIIWFNIQYFFLCPQKVLISNVHGQKKLFTSDGSKNVSEILKTLLGANNSHKSCAFVTHVQSSISPSLLKHFVLSAVKLVAVNYRRIKNSLQILLYNFEISLLLTRWLVVSCLTALLMSHSGHPGRVSGMIL